MNPIRKLAGQTAIYGLPTIIGRILTYLLVPLHTHIFSTADYGILNFYYALVAFLAVIFTYGMETAFFRFVSTSANPKRTYSTTQLSLLFTSIPLLLLLWVFSPGISNLLGYASKPEYLRWFALVLTCDALCAIPFARLRIENKAFRFATIKFINILLTIFFNLIFLLVLPLLYKKGMIGTAFFNPSYGIEYVILSNLLASVTCLLILLPYVLDIRAGFDKLEWKKLFRYAFPLLFFGMAGIVNETFDRFLLRFLLPANVAEAQIGIYGACYKIAILMSIFVQAYRYAAEPFFFLEAKQKEAKKTFSDMMTYFVIAASFLFLVTTLFLDTALLFLGKDFRSGREIIPILLLANLCLGIFYNLSVWYKLTDKTRIGAYIAVFGAGITLLLNFLLIPHFGYMGAAWATFACYFLMMLVSYFTGKKYFPVPYELKRIFTYIGVALLFYLIDRNLPIETKSLQYVVKFAGLLAFLFLAYRLNFSSLFSKRKKA